jgi:hypothetical protein
MRDESFLSKAIQVVGFITSIAGLVTQYLLREDFKQLLKIVEDHTFSAFSFGSMITGFVLIIGLYSSRQVLGIKKYFWGYSKYLKSIRDPKADPVSEPFYIDGKRIAWSAVVVSFASFLSIILVSDPLWKSILYSIFVVLLIFSVTIFLLAMYSVEEWRNGIRSRKERLKDRIQDFFAPQYKEVSRHEDTSNFLVPVIRQVIEVQGTKYSVTSDLNDPDKYFHVEKINNAPQKSGKI